MRLTSNTKASSRRSKWLPWNGRGRGAVVEDVVYNKLERLNVQAGKKDKILAAHVQRICEAHPTISKYMGRLGLTRRRRWRTLDTKFVCK